MTGSIITCASIVIDHYNLVDPRREERAVGCPAAKCFERWRDETGTFEIHTIIGRGAARMGNCLLIAATLLNRNPILTHASKNHSSVAEPAKW
jgi:hypothetical protein